MRLEQIKQCRQQTAYDIVNEDGIRAKIEIIEEDYCTEIVASCDIFGDMTKFKSFRQRECIFDPNCLGRAAESAVCGLLGLAFGKSEVVGFMVSRQLVDLFEVLLEVNFEIA